MTCPKFRIAKFESKNFKFEIVLEFGCREGGGRHDTRAYRKCSTKKLATFHGGNIGDVPKIQNCKV